MLGGWWLFYGLGFREAGTGYFLKFHEILLISLNRIWQLIGDVELLSTCRLSLLGGFPRL